MGVDSLQHMTKLAQELRASMPTQTEHQQAQSSEFGADAARAAAPARSGVSVIARRAPLTGSLRRSTRAGHGESEMLLLEKVRRCAACLRRTCLARRALLRRAACA